MNANREGVENQLESITDQIEEGIRRGKFTWKELQGAFMEKTREAAQTTDTYVHENPWKVIGIAAALGLVVGLLLSPRGESEE